MEDFIFTSFWWTIHVLSTTTINSKFTLNQYQNVKVQVILMICEYSLFFRNSSVVGDALMPCLLKAYQPHFLIEAYYATSVTNFDQSSCLHSHRIASHVGFLYMQPEVYFKASSMFSCINVRTHGEYVLKYQNDTGRLPWKLPFVFMLPYENMLPVEGRACARLWASAHCPQQSAMWLSITVVGAVNQTTAAHRMLLKKKASKA